ncbi:hypothetical protein F414_gp27 [Cronobacter phage ESP2949-1]|uniref:Uncharacterized protein n=1 Tax=Cronobacter phage ESP2949-1 TaxID=2920894 RepID=G1CSS4_9CAUD|nr:hypothetical protein F414_gp27 [Cronobacter phage ESP2949-1]AEM24804.1 hypothetical protein [Cronobacter phage ESP2949-1]
MEKSRRQVGKDKADPLAYTSRLRSRRCAGKLTIAFFVKTTRPRSGIIFFRGGAVPRMNEGKTMNTYDLTTKNVPAFEVVENGPDSTDYVVATVKGETAARLRASSFQDRNGYLGYGYVIRQVAE